MCIVDTSVSCNYFLMHINLKRKTVGYNSCDLQQGFWQCLILYYGIQRKKLMTDFHLIVTQGILSCVLLSPIDSLV